MFHIQAQKPFLKLYSSNDKLLLEDSILYLDKGDNIISALDNYVDVKIEQSFLEASIDSLKIDTMGSNHKGAAFIHLGPKYDFSELAKDTANLKLFESWKVDPPKRLDEFVFLRQKVNKYYANNGYPFAKLNIKDIKLSENKLSGQYYLQKGPRIIIDSILINGNLKLRKAYLENYLGIDQGQLYNHEEVGSIFEKLSKLSFLEQVKNPELTFFGNYSTVNLFLNQKNTSRFDLLFGVIPTNSVQGRQLFLSLDFTTELLNKLGYGEYLFVNFERLRPEQQLFEFKFNYPYILSLPYAIDFDFGIFRNSLDYQTLKSNLGVQYLVDPDIQLKLGWDFESTNIVELDTTLLLTTQMLPQDLDIDQSGITLEAMVNKLDYRFNPRKGFSIEAQGGAGRRTIKRNTSVLSLSNEVVDFSTAYDTLNLNSFRYELSLNTSLFLPVALRGTVGWHSKSAWRYNENGLFRNEKFQIGGNKLMRGFDEASFFTSYYFINTLEYRLLLSQNSYFSVPFIDIGLIENDQNDAEVVIGLGSSLGIETKAGLFNFSIAVGRTKEMGFDFRRPKAHFGFISLF